MASRHLLCPYCRSTISTHQRLVRCQACDVAHHAECWRENGRCTTYGCRGLPGQAQMTAQSDVAADGTPARPVIIDVSPEPAASDVSGYWTSTGGVSWERQRLEAPAGLTSVAGRALLGAALGTLARLLPFLTLTAAGAFRSGDSLPISMSYQLTGEWLLDFRDVCGPGGVCEGIAWYWLVISALGLVGAVTALWSGAGTRRTRIVRGAWATAGVAAFAWLAASTEFFRALALLLLALLSLCLIAPAMALDHLGLAWGQFGVGPVAASALNGAYLGIAWGRARWLCRYGQPAAVTRSWLGAAALYAALLALGLTRQGLLKPF